VTYDKYMATKHDFLVLKEDIVGCCGEENRVKVEQLLTLTRILDRSASEYAKYKDNPAYYYDPVAEQDIVERA